LLNIDTLRVTGADALEFLQGQLTNDLGRLETEPEILAAWCNPKGRVIWFDTVRPIDGGYACSIVAGTGEDIVRRLTLFRFRSKVDFEIVGDGASIDESFLVENGYPWIGEAQREQYTPHMLNLDLLDAVSFDKGCYTGQEIVARTHYKGATKRRTLRFKASAPITEGDKVQLDGRDVGDVLNVAGDQLLAVVPVDKADAGLTAGGASLVNLPLPYMQADGRDLAGET
jgi:folate-binding protein YgfZ